MNYVPSLPYVTKLPEVETSLLRGLQWEIDHWSRQYAEAGAQKELAWKIYQDAIDNSEPREQIEDLYALAKMFEAICTEAWHALDNAKAQLLALHN